MYRNEVFPSIVEALPTMLGVLENEGSVVESRAGTTKELTHVGITLLEPWNREILVKNRKPNLAAQIAETMWVLAGRDDIAWLENYLPRVRDFSDDGETWRAGYGARLRRWEDHGHAKVIDQWRFIVEHLASQPESRRAVMSIWDPTIDTQDGKDIPCNDWLSFLGRNGRLDLHVAVRSNDAIWGWSGINQFEWSALLEITANMTGMECGALHFSTTSFHLYDHHFAKAERIREARLPFLDDVKDSPRFDGSVVGYNFDSLQELFDLWFRLEYDIRTGSPLVQHYVDNFPEPMMRSWLRILQWWWSGGVRQAEYLEPLAGTRLEVATDYCLQPKRREHTLSFDVSPGAFMEIVPAGNHTLFIEGLCRLHLEKEAAYGGSWKKRGELFSILPNVGRKVDRLGTGGVTEDETSADTAGDLFVYLAKYQTWLDEHLVGGASWEGLSDAAINANHVMEAVEEAHRDDAVRDVSDLVETLQDQYESLLKLAEAKDPARRDLVGRMLPIAYMLARHLWENEGSNEYLGADVD